MDQNKEIIRAIDRLKVLFILLVTYDLAEKHCVVFTLS